MPGVELAPGVRKDGRLSVVLNREGRRRTRLIHQLVLEAFVGPRPNGMEGCHNDGICTNNVWTNLRWDTRAGNAADTKRHGTCYQLLIENCPAGHPLELPNLVGWHLRHGKRLCLACSRAHKRKATARKNGVPFDFQAVADALYEKIKLAG